MTLSTNTTYRILVEKLGATDPDAFVGNEGEVFFDPSIPTLKLSDGSTPGGIGIGIGTASVGTALTVSGDSGSETIDILSETLTIAGGTNLTSSAASDTVTVNLDSDISLDSVTATGIITATGGFDGDLTGNVTGTASTASFATTAFTLNDRVESEFNVAFAQTAGLSTETTKLQTPRTFEITGDVVASPIAFDGTGNVSLAATIQPNSVGLGTDTFGDYVKNISGTANQISVTGGTGEGSTPVISIPDSPVFPGTTVTVSNDLQVNNNLNVNGNITIGGTTAIIYAQEFIVTDKEIVLGFTTDSFGNEVSNDITADGGGISIASTEGNPLVDFNIAGVHTHPNTYKDIIWIKAGTLGAGTTDAWHFNYGVGIGSTQVPNGVRFAVSNIQFTDNDLTVIRNIDASGIVTASGGFVGNLTGTASIATEFTVTANDSTNETVYPVFVDAATGSQGAETDAALSYNPSTNTLTAGTFNSTSDRKLKENVKVVKNASELINKLEGVNFTWIETGEKSVGVIAQQVESYIPELVSENQEVKSVNYNGLVGILIEAFKEQQRQIEELKEVIQNL
jgi:hypothetical protein